MTDYFEDKSFMYVITEYCAGEDIVSSIKHRYDELKVKNILKAILIAVNIIH